MTVRPERSQGLGRGLAALIPQRAPGSPGPADIAVDRVRPNPYQPRRHFDAAELATLTASIREHGVLQPILVTEAVDGYQLVAGERRLRAAIAAGLERIPAIVRQLDDRSRLEIALIENLQREDLDPIEAAQGFRRLIDEFGFTHEQLAARVGRARSTVANTLRLLDLSPAVQAAVVDRRLTEGHARALGGLSVEHQEHVLGTVVDQDLSVRQTEELVRRLREPKPAATGGTAAPSTERRLDPDLERLEEDLRRALGTKVSLARARTGGRIVIEYYSDEELGRLYERLTGGTA
jgi:ParB family chromosome partitioning protein